ncbi:4-coumarate--CoA ligase [Arenibaculum pallidiluteum]|uniref:4-coumarate--CoA ligase n=1 Tax=Arenibaculum pallidiluteum TaxID=2812559 RepID=UPI001A968F2D|nr:4-coumarate--CoA ligase [Arenibaculum pallidiluteum]
MTDRPWWVNEGSFSRVVADLISDELAKLRPGEPRLAVPRPWPEDLLIGDGGLGADSLELLQLSAALTELFQIHRSGIEDYLLVRRTLGGWLEVARAALARFDGEMTFRTSGSTGAGKPCPHPLLALEEEAAHLAGLLPGRRRVLSAVPAHHIYGFLFTVLLPAHLDAEVLDLRERSPAALGALLRPGDLVVGHPEFWRAVLRAAPLIPGDVAGTSSTAPCPAETARGVRGLGLSRLVEVFGSSETAGLGWRDDPDAGFRPFPWWRFEEGEVLRILPGGAASRPLQDRLAWEGGEFRPGGRLDSVVQVGGVNVSPRAVRERLLDHPHVAECAVRLMRPDEGTRLKAFVVPSPHAPPEAELRAQLSAWIEGTLPVPQRPRALSFGPALPTGELGKAADWPVAFETRP